MIEIPVETVLSCVECTVGPETAVTEAGEKLRDPAVPALVVLEDETVTGIVSESDFVALVADGPEAVPVSEIMSAPVVTVEPTTTVRTAIETMREEGIKHLPVVDDDIYQGLVSIDQLAPYVSNRQLDVEWTGQSPPLNADEASPVVGE